jgi:hypothetical protein
MTTDKKCFKCNKLTYTQSIGDGVYGWDAPYLCMNYKDSWEKDCKQSADNVDNVTNELWKYWFERWAGKKVKINIPLRSFIFR